MAEEEVFGIRTRTPAMLRVIRTVRLYAGLDTPVLIEGETGTGKELVARALHASSPRAGRRMVTADCAALPETLAESELFGHERGAYTGADRPYAGRIHLAAGGTLFLDEVNSLSLGIQGKLLRFLERGEFTRIGQQQPVSIDVRVVSATNAPLETLVASGAMRADFYFRLNVLTLRLPPLRERPDDLPLLVEQFLEEEPLARQLGVSRVAGDVLGRLREMSWPGNVRELRNLLRRSLVLGAEGGVLRRLWTDADDVPRAVRHGDAGADGLGAFRSWMLEREREYLAELVERHPNIAQQSAVSGLPERTLYRKLRMLGLRRGPLRAPLPPRCVEAAEA
jgi:transcriptional regulator with PAS, ATPase and Fis domain